VTSANIAKDPHPQTDNTINDHSTWTGPTL